MPIHPISFCVPESLLVCSIEDTLAQKKTMEAVYKPGDPYAFSTPEAYYQMYREAFFGMTKKKGGWDCFRHLEILACGCLPVYENLDNIPTTIMMFYPKDIMVQASQLYHIYQEKKEWTLEHVHTYTFLVKMSIQHVKKHLTTVAMARYLLRTVFGYKPQEESLSILFLSTSHRIDFQRCLLLHGLKMLCKEKCVDVARVPHLYQSYPLDILHQAGAGFGFAGTVPEEYDVLCNRENIRERIAAKEFDVIIYGSIHRGMPYLDEVLHAYPTERIVYIDGEDCTPLFSGRDHDSSCPLTTFCKQHGHLFVREYSGIT